MISEMMTDLGTEAMAALEAAGLDTVRVTEDSRAGLSALSAGSDVVLVQAPSIEFETRRHWIATHELWVIVSTGEMNTAQARLSKIVPALVAALDIARAEPDEFTTNQTRWSGYRLTTTSTTWTP